MAARVLLACTFACGRRLVIVLQGVGKLTLDRYREVGVDLGGEPLVRGPMNRLAHVDDK